MPRFSLRALAAFIGLMAVYCAALVNASPMLACGAVLATVVILMLAIAAAVEGRSAFWRMFAIWGWLYFLLALCLSDSPVRPLTESLLLSMAKTLPDATMAERILIPALDPTVREWGTRLVANQQFFRDFTSIGQSGLTLLVAWLGGLVGQFMRARRLTDRAVSR
jgi:hypothetical protein